MSSTEKTTKVWELLPTAAKKDIVYPATLEEGTLREIGAKSAMPVNMLKLLFRKLSRDKNVPPAVRLGLDYFLYFIDDKDGVKKDSQKMDFLTYYLIVVDGLVHWPLEITMALRKLAEKHAMYKIAEKVNTAIIRTQLSSEQDTDGTTRKSINCEDLSKCADVVLQGSASKKSATKRSNVSTRDLALDHFSEWTDDHWKSAIKLKRFSTPVEVEKMEKMLQETLMISKEKHEELASELKSNEVVALMSDAEKNDYQDLLSAKEFSRSMKRFHVLMLESDYDLNLMLEFALPPLRNFEKSWGLVDWDKLVFLCCIVLEKEKQSGIYDISKYSQGGSSDVQEQELITKNLQVVESKWVQSLELKYSLNLTDAQRTVARYLSEHTEAINPLFEFQSTEENCLRSKYQNEFEAVTGHNEMSQITDVTSAAFKEGVLQYLRGVAVEIYFLDVL